MMEDKVTDAFEMFEKDGQVIFLQQQAIYRQLAREVEGSTVVEAGCGIGVGAAMMNQTARSVHGSDKSERNVRFARCVYPWLSFFVWDITKNKVGPYEVVVAVEVIEHVNDIERAVHNLRDSAVHEIWISTPNGTNKPLVPENPLHVREYTPEEICLWMRPYDVTIHHPDTWEILNTDTDVDPLVYHVWKQDRIRS